ncbi:hypothetical protein ACFY7Z_01455 [Streptomyces sp. NPDC012623]|uniref:hypothetical protein n=1 Tax=unclassified Streptomyces TaxID=2593676 RepID=UPI0036B764A7
MPAGLFSVAPTSLREAERAADKAESRIGTFGGFSSVTSAYATVAAACATWGKVLDCCPAVHSGRIDGHVMGIPALLAPYRSTPAARHLLERTRVAVRSRTA